MYKDTGINRAIDCVGRIVLPIEYRSVLAKSFLSYKEDDSIIMVTAKEGIRGRKLDDIGRFCIPKESRTILEWKEHDKLEIYLDEETGSIKLVKIK